ncbi:MAG: indole-3-glycerol-phosphate synthase [Deltaproteobacteria bacterium]|nr:indole-3-glycerol-phosphate synthase [Deltaproteobacteria bacterium]
MSEKSDLQRFIEAKEASVKALKKRKAWVPFAGRRPSFGEALARGRAGRGLGLIAEYKRASPSMGDINLALAPEEAALAFGAADCLSVLTEEAYFKGSLGFLGRVAFAGKPILRKDFVFDPVQILETAETPASAVLLMARLTPDLGLLKGLREAAESQGLEPVVEVFGLAELEMAREAGARLIQFNSRDLRSLAVDKESSFSLALAYPPAPGELYIAASGINGPGQLADVARKGFGAALVGTCLMSAPDPGEALESLLGGLAPLAPGQNTTP